MASQSGTTSSKGTERTTVEFRNEIPFPVKIYRQSGKEAEVFCNLLDGYSRYVQEAAVTDILIVRLACNGWEVSRIGAQTYAQTCSIDANVLRSKSASSADSKVKVALDLPIRAYEAFRVDEQGKESSLAKVDNGQGVAFETTEGSVVRGAGLGANSKATYFWLIVTPKGEANFLGQTFSTGTGWGIVPEIGEVAVFMDLAVGKDDKYEPDKTPDEPFYMVFHGDVPDLSVFFDSPAVQFPQKARTTTKTIALGASAAKPKTLDEVLGYVAPKNAATPTTPGVKSATSGSAPTAQSGGPIFLAAIPGPGTQAVFYENAQFGGDAYSPDDGAFPPGQKAASLKLEVVENAAQMGITALTSLSEDVDADEKEGGKTSYKFRTTLNLPPNIQYVEVGAWEEDVDIEIEGEQYRIGPNAAARIPANDFGRITLKIDADEPGASEILIRTDAMPQGHALIVCPDEEMHTNIAGLSDDALYKSGLADPKFGQDDCAQVQKALQQISQTLINSHAETSAGVTNKRRVDPSLMSDAHWVLSLDPASGKPSYAAVSSAQAAQINASASKEIHDTEKGLGQSIFSKKSWSKVGKVVVSTASDAGKAVESAAKDTGKAVESAAKDTGKAVVSSANEVADGVKYAAHEVAHSLVVTVHFLEDNVPGLRFVMRSAGRLAAAVIKSIVSMVEIAVDKFVQWLSFIFDWGDIEHTQKVLEQTLKNGLAKLKNDVVGLKEGMQTQVANLRAQIEKAKGQSAPADTQTRATSPAHNKASEKGEWFFSLLRKHMPHVKSTNTTKALSGDLARIYKDFSASMSNLSNDLKGMEKDVSALGRAVAKGDFKAIFDAAKNLALSLLELALDTVAAMVTLVLDALALLIDLFLALARLSFEVPVLSWLWKKAFGSRIVFCPLSVGLVIPALFTTIACKLFTGHAPFRQIDSLALSLESQAEFGYALAAVDFASGISSAWSTMDAGKGPDGPTATWKTSLKLIFVAGKYLQYIMSPVICKNNTNQLIVYGFSAFPLAANLFSFVPGVDEGPMNKGKCIADAIYGAAKIVVGTVEAASGNPMEGGIQIAEGTGLVMELGGVSSNPVVYGLAAVGACNAMWVGTILNVFRAGKL